VILWRVSNHPVLDGRGGLRASGRWHTRGQRIAYCAPNPASALLEVLVHAEIDLGDIPVKLRYLEIEGPDSIEMATADIGRLGPRWQQRAEITRSLGDEWLRAGLTALLRVPSVIVPATWNVLVNPLHPDFARLRVRGIHHQAIDPRLIG
jgi:RES domain-containing protein